MSETIQKIKYRHNILPLEYEGKISKSVLAYTDKGAIVLKYDHLFEYWFDPQQKQKAFKGKVLKWCDIPG